MLAEIADRWTTGWRGLALAAAVALAAALPGLALPVTDREEAVTAQTTAQMLESGDFVAVSFQDRMREGRPVGVHWPQAASVAAFSGAAARHIWPYRIPSLLGAMLAAAACAWGAAAFWGQRLGTLAGAGLGVTVLAAGVGGLALPDALAAGLTALAMASLARLYGAGQGLCRAGVGARLLFWAAITAACLTGGWAPAAMAVLTALALWAADRKANWLKPIGWSWGLIAFCAVLGPWVMAITVTTDGGFWRVPAAPHRDLPGGDSLAALALCFPLLALLPGAAVLAWRERAEPGVRFALAWLIPAWLLFEIRPGANVADALLLLPPMMWLAAASWRAETGRVARWAGVLLSLAGGAVLVGFILYLLKQFGMPKDAWPGAVAAVFLVCAGLSAAFAVLRGSLRGLVTAGVLALFGQGVLIGLLAPGLTSLWPSRAVVAALHKAGLDPADGLVQGPVTVVGYDEPSLVFLLGAETKVGSPEEAAEALAQGRPVVIEHQARPAFDAALERRGVLAIPVANAIGLDYADNRPVTLNILRRAP